MNKEPKPMPATTAERRRNRRIVFTGVILGLCMVYLLYQIYHVQAVEGDRLQQEASEWLINRVSGAAGLTDIVPNRGWIMDRNMQPLASSHTVYNVVLDLPVLAERENRSIERGGENRRLWMDETLTALHEALDIPLHELQALFVWDAQTRWRPVVQDYWRILARNVPANIALPLRDEFPNIHAEEVSMRMHPDPFFAPQVLGFIRGGAAWGLEGHYFSSLSGEPGRSFRAFDANNTPIRDEIPVRHGHTLITTLDADIQRLAQETVDHTYATIPSNAVAIVVMQPHTGEIFAMAQAPNFSLSAPANPAFFTDPRVEAEWADMDDQERENAWYYMWRNYHTTRSFEPGSVFKPVVVAAALEEGIISRHDAFFCNGAATIQDREIICFGRIPHGSLTLNEVLTYSCNVSMIEIMHRLGRNEFFRYRGYFGFGERTGIDLPGEEAVSSRNVMYPLEDLGPVQLATSSIGQGFNCTVIQAVTAFASLINGGNVMRPYVVSHVVDENRAVVHENRPQVVRRAVTQQTADWVRRELQNVITVGTGRNTQVTGHSMGGKTGTAQQGVARDNITISQWVYTPLDNPEFIVFMVIDNVEDTNRTAGNTISPILRGFMEELIVLRNLPPSDGEFTDNFTGPVVGPAMPNYEGERVSHVVRNLINQRIAFQIHGGGTVITHHFPAAGISMPAPDGIPVQLFTDPATRLENGMTFMPNVTNLNAAQANDILRDAKLTPVWFDGEDELGYYTVFLQYPAPGTEVEQNMHVMLRVRRIE